MEKHVTIVGALNIGFGILTLLIGGLLFVLLTGAGLISQDQIALFITTTIGVALGAFLFIVGLPGIIGGIGLLYHKRWARIVVLILSVIDLINIPFGTFLGIYSIWVLVHEDTVKLFDKTPITSPSA